MATIDAGAAAPAPVKVTPIRENTPEKAELIDLFETKKWGKLPPANSDDDLEAILKKNNWNRSQLINHLRVWNRLGANGSKIIKRSKEEIVQSFQGNCDTAAEVLKKTWASRDVVALLPLVQFAKGSREKMEDESLWKGLMNDVFNQVAENHAASANRIPEMTATNCRSTEKMIQDLWKSIAEPEISPIRSFFYVFTNVFISILSKSYVEPDLDEFEDGVIETIVNNKDVSLLSEYHDQALYFILGFVLMAIDKEASRRKRRGLLMKAFAERNSLTKDQIKKAIEDKTLPLQKTARQSDGGLRYPTMHFYRTMGWVENIYCALLTDPNLDDFGGDTINRVVRRISTNTKIRSFLANPIGRKAEGADVVIDHVLDAYRRIRGSDFANKLLARGDKSYAIATRTSLQATTDAKRKKQKVEHKQDSSVLDSHHSLEDEIAFEASCASDLMAFSSCCVGEEEQLAREEMYSESENEEDFDDEVSIDTDIE